MSQRALLNLPGGRRAVTGSHDGTVRFWDVTSMKELDRIDLATSNDGVESLALAPDGRSLFVGTRRGVILRFELRSGE